MGQLKINNNLIAEGIEWKSLHPDDNAWIKARSIYKNMIEINCHIYNAYYVSIPNQTWQSINVPGGILPVEMAPSRNIFTYGILQKSSAWYPIIVWIDSVSGDIQVYQSTGKNFSSWDLHFNVVYTRRLDYDPIW